MKSPLIFWGATGQSIVLEEILSQNYSILALFDNNHELSSQFTKVPLYFGEEQFKLWLATNLARSMNFIVAIGGANGSTRVSIHNMMKSKGLSPINAIHKTAFLASSVQYGEGTQIMANSNVCARVRLGDCVIINTSASIDHECILGDGVHIGPGAILAGCVTVGKNTFIGAGAVVLPNITIGDNVVVGAGSVVTRNINSGVLGYGNPFTQRP